MRLLILAAAAACLHAQSFAPVRAFIQEKLTERRLPSVAIAVARDGRILWEEGFGWADRENRLRATEHTLYSLASISKPITATGLMILKQDGRVDLDKPVNQYLGSARLRGFAGDANAATVRMVANHTSGLPLHYQFFYADEPYQPPSMDETIRRYGILVTPPGEHYEYSNIGYGILDHVISQVSGRPYEDFMREHVFLPLGLTHMSVHIGRGLEKHAAQRYGGDGLPIPFYRFDHTGASAVYASAHDLVRFGMFHLKTRLADQKRILSDRTIAEMQQGENYGIGWSLAERYGYRTVSHNGGMGGVATTLMLVPSERIAVVALANASDSLPMEAAHRALNVLLPRWRTAAASGPRPEPDFKPPAELLGSWSGTLTTHKSEQPFTLRVLESGDVHVRLARQLRALLNMVSFEDGFLRGRMAGDIDTDDAARTRHIIQLKLKLRGRTLNGSATAMSMPGKRAGNALTSWLALKKE
jgi:CubicO group peptidase (beta-lactamase class C family)